jgi:hypothetical protein
MTETKNTGTALINFILRCAFKLIPKDVRRAVGRLWRNSGRTGAGGHGWESDMVARKRRYYSDKQREAVLADVIRLGVCEAASKQSLAGVRQPGRPAIFRTDRASAIPY